MPSHQRTSTPSPPRMPHTPSAPRLGAWQDAWEPYTPRKSARLSQRAANRTPSPPPQSRQSDATIASPTHSPRKRSQRNGTSTTNSPATSTAESAAVTAEAQMLPTPSKSPQKAQAETKARSLHHVARSLFPQDQVVPTPKRHRAKKYSGMSLHSFTAEDVEEDIDIFVDREERLPRFSVPVKDTSKSNPFQVTNPASESAKRHTKRRKVLIPGEGAVPVDEAVNRTDGRTMVFRGKKVWAPYEDGVRGPELGSVARKLFQDEIAQMPIQDEYDEEVDTDVEYPESAKAIVDPQTPAEAVDEPTDTPKAPKFAPMSPPDTRRTTRFANKLSKQLTSSQSPAGKGRLFDSWQRTKDSKETPRLKRQGSDLAAASPKRLRGRRSGEVAVEAPSQ